MFSKRIYSGQLQFSFNIIHDKEAK